MKSLATILRRLAAEPPLRLFVKQTLALFRARSKLGQGGTFPPDLTISWVCYSRLVRRRNNR